MAPAVIAKPPTGEDVSELVLGFFTARCQPDDPQIVVVPDLQVVVMESVQAAEQNRGMVVRHQLSPGPYEVEYLYADGTRRAVVSLGEWYLDMRSVALHSLRFQVQTGRRRDSTPAERQLRRFLRAVPAIVQMPTEQLPGAGWQHDVQVSVADPLRHPYSIVGNAAMGQIDPLHQTPITELSLYDDDDGVKQTVLYRGEQKALGPMPFDHLSFELVARSNRRQAIIGQALVLAAAGVEHGLASLIEIFNALDDADEYTMSVASASSSWHEQPQGMIADWKDGVVLSVRPPRQTEVGLAFRPEILLQDEASAQLYVADTVAGRALSAREAHISLRAETWSPPKQRIG